MFKTNRRKCIIDFKMRKVEKEYIENLGLEIIENKFNLDLYDEIASHPDICYLKINDKLIISKCSENFIKDKITDLLYIVGDSILSGKYPLDVPYNICIIAKNAIHNFKYTDKKVVNILTDLGYNLINVEQGYAKCSTFVLDSNSAITSDITIAKELLDKGIDVLLTKEPDIKLLKRTNQNINEENKMFFQNSQMQGFIGGAMVRIDNKVIVFGDLNNLINNTKIRKFIEKRGLEIIDFKGLDIIDYGGIIII